MWGIGFNANCSVIAMAVGSWSGGGMPRICKGISMVTRDDGRFLSMIECHHDDDDETRERTAARDFTFEKLKFRATPLGRKKGQKKNLNSVPQ